VTRIRLLHSLALALLLAAPAVEARESAARTLAPKTVQDQKVLREGDMVVGPYSPTLSSDISLESAATNSSLRWPKVNGKVVVPYVLSPSLSTAARQAIAAAINQYASKTCVSLVPRTNQVDYVSFFAGQGCYSYVGNMHQGAQELSLGAGCEYTGTAVHEIMHALGFFHEQSRPDRDQYVTVQFQNVQSGMEYQFEVCQNCSTQSLPYEYASIMHDGPLNFSRNGQPTLMPKQAGVQLKDAWQKPGLTTLDIKKLHKLYQCP